MKSENRDLRELFQAFVRANGRGDREKCPSVQDLVDSFDPKASRRKKKKIIDHLSECGDCREEFRLYLELNKLAEATSPSLSHAPTDKAPRVPPLSSGSLWRYAAITVGLGLILSGIFLLKKGEIPEAERSPAGTGIVLVEPVAARVQPEEIVF